MRILWIPHCPTTDSGWEGCRQFHLFRHLGRHNELHWVNWRQTTGRSSPPRWGAFTEERRSEGVFYTISLAPNFYRLLRVGYPTTPLLALNQALFRRAVHAIASRVQPDVAVYSSSHHWTGFPPFDLGVPIVFDYIDRSPDWVERAYTRSASAVVAITPDLASSAARHGKPTTVISNGVDYARYASVDRDLAKARLGLGGHRVVSLIGLTCSPELYFVDAFAALQRDRDDLALLIVGGGATRDRIVRRAEQLGVRSIHAPGAVPNSEVHWYFAASDVGLYPGEDNPYYRQAAPLKTVEYTAAACQVVSSPVDMFRHGWPNVRLVEATADGFRHGIREALDDPLPCADASAHDWRKLAEAFDQVLTGACGHNQMRRPGQASQSRRARRGVPL